jgi:hypothetical protein
MGPSATDFERGAWRRRSRREVSKDDDFDDVARESSCKESSSNSQSDSANKDFSNNRDYEGFPMVAACCARKPCLSSSTAQVSAMTHPTGLASVLPLRPQPALRRKPATNQISNPIGDEEGKPSSKRKSPRLVAAAMQHAQRVSEGADAMEDEGNMPHWDRLTDSTPPALACIARARAPQGRATATSPIHPWDAKQGQYRGVTAHKHIPWPRREQLE